jgi:hypothetical protein
MFFFSFAGTLYFAVMGHDVAGRPDAAIADRRAYSFFGVGILLLSIEPALILFTASYWIVGVIALGFWVAFLAVLIHSWRAWTFGP